MSLEAIVCLLLGCSNPPVEPSYPAAPTYSNYSNSYTTEIEIPINTVGGGGMQRLGYEQLVSLQYLDFSQGQSGSAMRSLLGAPYRVDAEADYYLTEGGVPVRINYDQQGYARGFNIGGF